MRPMILALRILYFEDLSVGMTETLSKTIASSDVVGFAQLTGDRNPIHLDAGFAKRVGLPGNILHGMCTMAFVQTLAVDRLCGPNRDPLRLKRLSVRFSHPVVPGESIAFRGYRIEALEEGGKYGVLAVNPEGKEVLKNVWCLVASE